MKKLILITVIAELVGCATGSPKATSTSTPQAKVAAAQTMTVSGNTVEMSGSRSCPTSLSKGFSLNEGMKAAAACVRAGQWSKVEEYGNALAIQYSNDPWGSYYLSLSAEHAKDLSRARWMAELAVKKSPNEGVTIYQLGRMQWLMGEKMTSLETLKKAADKNPTLSEAQVLLGQIALLDEKKSDAEKSFLKAVERDDQNLSALMGLAEVYRMNKRWQDQEKYLRQAISSHPKHLAARLQLAQGLESMAQDMSGALDAYREIQRLDRDHKLDATLSFDLSSKIQSLQATVAEQAKRKAAERKPSNDGKKVSK